MNPSVYIFMSIYIVIPLTSYTIYFVGGNFTYFLFIKFFNYLTNETVSDVFTLNMSFGLYLVYIKLKSKDN